MYVKGETFKCDYVSREFLQNFNLQDQTMIVTLMIFNSTKILTTVKRRNPYNQNMHDDESGFQMKMVVQNPDAKIIQKLDASLDRFRGLNFLT